MDFVFLSDAFVKLCLTIIKVTLVWAVVLGGAYLIWKLGSFVYQVATTPSGVHYISQERRCLQMTTSVRNPFQFKADFSRASSSGINCILKCDKKCYVLGICGVPIYSLVKLLNEDWHVLLSTIANSNDRESPEAFAYKCSFVFEPFILAAEREQAMEFITETNGVMQSEDSMHLRKTYPFVVLMVLVQEDVEINSDPFVVAIANAVHIPDKYCKNAYLIKQFVKLSSGHVGPVKKVFNSIEGRENDLCLICNENKASIVQVSCQHFCVCRRCYMQVDKCPVCRNRHMDFFEVSNHDDMDFNSH